MGLLVSILSLSSQERRNFVAVAIAISTRKLPFYALSVVLRAAVTDVLLHGCVAECRPLFSIEVVLQSLISFLSLEC